MHPRSPPWLPRLRPGLTGPGREIRVLARVLIGTAALAACTARAASGDLDPARVGWSEVRMTASKLFLTAETRLSFRIVPGPSVVPDLLPLPAAVMTPVAPGADVVELLYDTRGLGRASRLTLLMDPGTGAAIQLTNHDSEGKLRLRTYRFGAEGAFQRTRWPASDSERSLLPARWTRTSEGLRAYPALPGKRAVLEPTGLLYAIAAAALNQPGDALELLVFRRRDTQAVRIEVVPAREVPVSYDELWPKGSVQRSGKVMPIRLTLRGIAAPGGDPDDGLELLGLSGNLELLLDPASRAPLELSGNVKVVGLVTLRLTALRLR